MEFVVRSFVEVLLIYLNFHYQIWPSLLVVSRKQSLQFTPTTAESCDVLTSQSVYFRSLVCSGFCAVKIHANMAPFIGMRDRTCFCGFEFLARNLKANVNILVLFNLRAHGNWRHRNPEPLRLPLSLHPPQKIIINDVSVKFMSPWESQSEPGRRQHSSNRQFCSNLARMLGLVSEWLWQVSRSKYLIPLKLRGPKSGHLTLTYTYLVSCLWFSIFTTTKAIWNVNPLEHVL